MKIHYTGKACYHSESLSKRKYISLFEEIASSGCKVWDGEKKPKLIPELNFVKGLPAYRRLYFSHFHDFIRQIVREKGLRLAVFEVPFLKYEQKWSTFYQGRSRNIDSDKVSCGICIVAEVLQVPLISLLEKFLRYCEGRGIRLHRYLEFEETIRCFIIDAPVLAEQLNPLHQSFHTTESKVNSILEVSAGAKLTNSDQNFSSYFSHDLKRRNRLNLYERKDIYRRILLCINTHKSGYILIEGNAGMGKSCLMAYVASAIKDARQFNCVWYFHEMSSGQNRSADLLKSIFLQLKCIYQCLNEPQIKSEFELVLEHDAGYAYFYNLIFDRLANLKEVAENKLIILIDALDEMSSLDISRHEAVNSSFLPHSLIDHVYIVVSSREFNGESYADTRLHISLTSSSSDQRNDIEKYLRQQAEDSNVRDWIFSQKWEYEDNRKIKEGFYFHAPWERKGLNKIDAFIECLITRSELSFIYLYYFFLSLDEYDKNTVLPAGVEGYYSQQIRRLCREFSSLSNLTIFRILESILRFEGTITLELLSVSVELPEDELFVVCESAVRLGLISEEMSTQGCVTYRLSHRTLSTYLRSHKKIGQSKIKPKNIEQIVMVVDRNLNKVAIQDSESIKLIERWGLQVLREASHAYEFPQTYRGNITIPQHDALLKLEREKRKEELDDIQRQISPLIQKCLKGLWRDF